MTQDPFYRIAALMMKTRQRELAVALLAHAAEARFLLEGGPVRASALPEGMTLTAADEGKRYVCLTGEDGLIPLCRNRHCCRIFPEGENAGRGS